MPTRRPYSWKKEVQAEKRDKQSVCGQKIDPTQPQIQCAMCMCNFLHLVSHVDISNPQGTSARSGRKKKARAFIPADFSREEMAVKFREACRQAGQAQNLREVIVVMEPHKKFKPERSGPEMHFHVVFRMRNNFAHLQITKWLANHAGCRGHMSYPRKGWKEMVRYVLEDSAVNLHTFGQTKTRQ